MRSVEEYSVYLQTQLKRHPEWREVAYFQDAYRANELKEKGKQFMASAKDVHDLNTRLRVFRNQQMVRIAQRDLLGLASLEEGFMETSDLADILVETTMDWHFKVLVERFGMPIGEASNQPQSLLVIAMGKLGGQELNFSSDIDLIYVFPERGQTQGGQKVIDNEQFFTRLAQAMNKSLTEYTEEGFVYRVDMRLRPFGSTGPLVASFNAMENYYALHGRAWERYALVKARIMTGDIELGEQLMSILCPFVYRKYVDFTALDALRDLKRQIAEKVRKEGMQDNIKLGRGGIREIEFIVQVFQLIHGGKIPSLQGRSLLPMLHEVTRQGFLDAQVAQLLEKAYRFLRQVENHLQMRHDQQVHSLPQAQAERESLAASVGLSLEAFEQRLDQERAFVQAQFESVFAVEVSEIEQVEPEIMDEIEAVLTPFYQQPKVQNLTQVAQQRLDKLLPMVLQKIRLQTQEIAQQVDLLKQVLKVFESILRRSVYFVLLIENPVLIDGLLKVCSMSPWMVDMLVKYPMLLESLTDMSGQKNPMTAEDYVLEAHQIQQEYAQDEEGFMNALRQWRHIQVFNIALADITGFLPVMKVSDYLTWIAEAVLQAVLKQAYLFMEQKYGLPAGVQQYDLASLPFVVVGYGKLGGYEVGYGSDLDVIFLFDEQAKSQRSQGPKPLEAGLYFLRMAQKLISMMTTLMPTGMLYEMDVRLRPNGNSGLLVVDFMAYQSYLKNKAWLWELQALVRARAVVGGEGAKSQFETIRKTCLAEARDADWVKKEVLDMRQKMKRSLDDSNEQYFNLKQGVGGIVDIEFMVQYFVLAYAKDYPNLLNYTDNIQILTEIGEVNLLPDKDTVLKLIEIYQLYRKTYHYLSLQNKPNQIENEQYQSERMWVAQLWQEILE